MAHLFDHRETCRMFCALFCLYWPGSDMTMLLVEWTMLCVFFVVFVYMLYQAQGCGVATSPSSITKHASVAQMNANGKFIRGFGTLGKRGEFTNHHKLFSRGNPHTRVLNQSGPVHKGGSPTVQVTTGNLTDSVLSSPTLHNALDSLLLCPFVQAASSFIPKHSLA